jgi:hypothetical protein
MRYSYESNICSDLHKYDLTNYNIICSLQILFRYIRLLLLDNINNKKVLRRFEPFTSDELSFYDEHCDEFLYFTKDSTLTEVGRHDYCDILYDNVVNGLAPGKQISTIIVDTYIYMVKLSHKSKECVFFPIVFAEELLRKEMKKLRTHTINTRTHHYRNINIFTKRAVFIPVHLPGHWVLLVIYPQMKTILYFDSIYDAQKSIE